MDKQIEGQITIEEYLEYLNSLTEEEYKREMNEQETCR